MKVTLAYSEAVDMLKKAYYPSYLSINENVELQIEPDVTAIVPEENPWIDVPKDWNYNQCPQGNDFGEIEIRTRCGGCHNGLASDWTAIWSQANHPFDIIQYRKVN